MSGCEACVLFLITARIIGPSSCTREHEASIGKREMSLTMCGHVQLTSQARYKYSDVAHCPSMMLCGTQNLCDHGGPAWAECTSSHPHVCARNASGCMSEQTRTLYLYLIITAAVAGRDFFFPKYMSAIFFRAGRSVLEPRRQTE